MSTIKPVTIPHEVADAIEWFRSEIEGTPGYSNKDIVEAVVTDRYGASYEGALQSIPFDTLMRALLDGYERELTEEEAREQAYADIRVMYAHHYDEAYEAYSDGYCDGVEYALNTLGIVIPGINNTPETEVNANV